MENRQGEGKNSIGNAEVKELICMTNGHELRYRNDGGKWGQRVEGNKGEKKLDNFNSIINNIYLKIEYKNKFSKAINI